MGIFGLTEVPITDGKVFPGQKTINAFQKLGEDKNGRCGRPEVFRIRSGEINAPRFSGHEMASVDETEVVGCMAWRFHNV